MVDLVAIQGAIGSIKAAKDIAKAAIGLRDAALLQSKVIELNEAILSAQSSAVDAMAEQSEMLQRVRELEQKIARLETWEAEKQRYKLEALPPGTHVYTLKSEMADGEPPHHICQTCYQRGKKSILNQGETHSGTYHLRCNECDADLKVGYWRPPASRGNTWTT